MALAVCHGAMMFHADVPNAHYCAERALSGSDGMASVSGGAAALRLKTTTRIGRSSGFGCSGGAEAAAVSSTTSSCRMQLMTSTSCHSSSRHEALRPRQSDLVVEEEAEEELASFWDRLQQAWRVLIGAPTEAQATKTRFSRLLVRDRGFNSANLSRLYKAAKGAIKEHVELEGDEDTEVMAVVDRLGELRLDFRVKRVKSVLMEEPFAHSLLPDMEPTLSISGDQLLGDSRAPHNWGVLTEGALDDIYSHSVLPNLEPSLFTSRDQLLEDRRDTHDSGVRLGGPLEKPFPSYVLPGMDPNLSVSGNQWEDNWASQGLQVNAGVALNLKSIIVVEALDEPVPNPALSAAEPSLSITGDQFWDDSRTTKDLADHVLGASNLEFTEEGAGGELFSSSVLPDVEPSLSISGGEHEDRTGQGLEVDVGEASNLESTTEIAAEGVWYTFSFMDAQVEQGTGGAQVNGDLDKQL